MSQSEIIISGFGGQGALFAGHALAAAGMAEGKHVTWLPSYGPEMRGGTAHVTVIIADEPIGSPIVQDPEIVIALNKPSTAKYEPLLRPGGALFVNSSLVAEIPSREDIDICAIPATEIAEALGSAKLANIVAVGALLGRRPLVEEDSLVNAIREMLGDGKEELVALNERALASGRNHTEEEPVRKGAGSHG